MAVRSKSPHYRKMWTSETSATAFLGLPKGIPKKLFCSPHPYRYFEDDESLLPKQQQGEQRQNRISWLSHLWKLCCLGYLLFVPGYPSGCLCETDILFAMETSQHFHCWKILIDSRKSQTIKLVKYMKETSVQQEDLITIKSSQEHAYILPRISTLHVDCVRRWYDFLASRCIRFTVPARQVIRFLTRHFWSVGTSNNSVIPSLSFSYYSAFVRLRNKK